MQRVHFIQQHEVGRERAVRQVMYEELVRQSMHTVNEKEERERRAGMWTALVLEENMAFQPQSQPERRQRLPEVHDCQPAAAADWPLYLPS
jgi:hypothetical protein